MPLLVPLGARRAGAVTAATETWTVSDATGTLNGELGWVQYPTQQWSVKTRAAELTGGAATVCGRCTTALAGSDYEVTATIEEWHYVDGYMYFGPCARMQGDSSLTFYVATLVGVPGKTSVILQRFTSSGGNTQIGSPLSVDVTPHTNMRLTTRCQAGRITALFDGVIKIVASNDTGILTGTSWGLEAYLTAGNRVRVADITAGPAQTARIPRELLSFSPMMAGVA